MSVRAEDEDLATASPGAPTQPEDSRLGESRARPRRLFATSWFEPLALAFLVIMAVAIRVPTLGQPLLEAHGFRQTQTAYTALLFRDEGVSLLHSRLPVLGPPFEVPFEFPLFQAAASLVMRVGLEPDLAMRVTALGCFVLTALLLYLFVRRFAGRLAAGCTLFAFLFAPFGYLWSRASLIEYMAAAAAVGFVWAAVEWREQPRPVLAAAAIAAGSVACLVKITTGAFFVIPVLVHRTPSDGRGPRAWLAARAQPTFLAIVGLPLLVAVVWTAYADSVKSGSPATAWLTSRALRYWNFGTLDQRLDIDNWGVIARRVIDNQLGLGIVDDRFPVIVAAALAVALAVWGIRGVPNRPLWMGWMLAGIAAVAVFFNLHAVHDYYQASVSPIAASLVGLGVAGIVRTVPIRPSKHVTVALGCMIVWLGASYAARDDEWARARLHIGRDDSRLQAAKRIARASRPDDQVVLVGYDWSPEILYYARRKGLMLRYGLLTDDVLRMLSSRDRLFVAADPAKDPIDLLDHWRWFGAIDTATYRLGPTRRSLGQLDVSATAASLERGQPVRGVVLRQGVSVPCHSRGFELPSWGSRIWISLAPAPSSTRIWLSRSKAPLPAVHAIVVRSTGASRWISCTGTPEIELLRVVGER